jgi:hypothetical protein
MEVLALRLVLVDADLAALAARAGDDDVRDLRAVFTPGGLEVTGRYRTLLMSVPFTTVWSLSASGTILSAKLTAVKVAGLPAGVLKSALLGRLGVALSSVPGALVSGDDLIFDPVIAARAQGIDLKLRLDGAYCAAGRCMIESRQPIGEVWS